MDPEQLKEVAEAFRSEAADYLATIQRDLLALEKETVPADRRKLEARLFRNCHSLKGSAGTLGFMEVERIAHHLEGALHNVQSGAVRLGPDLTDAVLAALDSVRGLLEASAAGREVPSAEVDAIAARLESAAGPVAPLAPHRPTQLPGDEPEVERTWTPGPSPAPPTAGAPGQTAEPERFDPSILEALADFVPHSTAAPAPPIPEPPLAADGGEETLRVPAGQLDAFVRRVEDVVTVKIRTERRLADVRQISHHLEDALGRVRQTGGAALGALEPLLAARRRAEQATRDLEQDSMQMGLITSALSRDLTELRMLPVAQVFEPLRRLVRDLARRMGKDVRLQVSGAEVRIDKRLLDQIRTPLVHLVRNAVAHGCETPKERRAAGKTPESTVEVAAEAREGTIAIWVADDGRGVDPAEVRDAAIRKKLLTLDEVTRLDDRRAIDLIFAAGFSLRDVVDEISGRGIGLDVVRDSAAHAGGRVEVETHVGRGSRFTLVLPLTMTTVRGLFVFAAGEVFAVPIAQVDRITRFPARAASGPGKDSIVLEGRQVPLVRLSELLGLTEPAPTPGAPIAAVVLAAGDRRAAFVVQSVADESDVVLKGLGPQLRRVAMIAGATARGDGRLVPVLDATELVMAATQDVAVRAKAAAQSLPRALVVDDSISTRMFLKRLLEGAGLDVVTAADGEEALDLLETSGCDVVVSDVNMPRLDGLGLVRRIRGHPTLKSTPVVLVSALGEDVEKTAGLSAGADAYIAKREFERGDVLNVVKLLIARRR